MGILKRKIKIKQKTVILIVVMNFLILGLYYAYAIFTIRQIKDDVSIISVNNSLITMSITDFDDNIVSVAANSSVNITVNLVNTSNDSIYYRIMHKGVPMKVSVYETDASSSSFGSINASDTKTSLITIDNPTSESISVIFYCQESKNSTFDKEIGYSYVNINKNLDHSGAYVPNTTGYYLPSNMIPVYYEASSATEGVWKKADVLNNDSAHIWYNYDKYMWANAVTVNTNVRENYQNASVGTEVSIGDINAFFVWIPGYKYNIVSSDGNTTLEHIINVNFTDTRSDINNNGTVSCVDSISNAHIYSETCTDSTYGQIYNNLSTYRHPSFKNTGVTGFWVGKFANPPIDNIVIRPNTSIAGTYTCGNLESKSRKMTLYDNSYGFNQNSNAEYNETTWLITNGMDAMESKRIDSMEWGAIAILTNSQYGKSNNSMYSSNDIKTFRRVYNNNNNMGYSGYSTYYNTSSSGLSTFTNDNASYNDLTDVSHTANSIYYPIGYRGAGASTTGTIYGVYDMSGAKIAVAAFFANSEGIINNSIDSKYYTAYSYVPSTNLGIVNSSKNSKSLDVFKLGDGIKEHVRYFGANGMWQEGTVEIKNSEGTFVRGGSLNNGSLFKVEIGLYDTIAATMTILK